MRFSHSNNPRGSCSDSFLLKDSTYWLKQNMPNYNSMQNMPCH